MTTKRQDITTTQDAREDIRPLSWENLGAHDQWEALWDTLKDLALDPRDFFDRMATSGGLFEPLGFLWAVLIALVLPSFPLALSYFGLTAPDPNTVSTAAYNSHLFLPRATGILTALLPLLLGACAARAFTCGTLLYLGSVPFGGRRWEGAISIWCYSSGAALAPLAAGTAVCAALSVLCYLFGLVVPSAQFVAAGIAHVGAWGLLGVGAAAGLLWFIVAFLAGCTRSLGLPGMQGVASAVCGVGLMATVLVFWPLATAWWGFQAATGLGSGLAVLLIFLFSAGTRPPEEFGQEDET